METIKIPRGTIFIRKGDKQKELFIILQGKVDVLTKSTTLSIEAGNIIGLMACAKQEYQCDYIASQDTVLMPYPYQKADDLKEIFKIQPKYAHVFALAAAKQADKVLSRYRKYFECAGRFYPLAIRLHRDYQFLCSKLNLQEMPLQRIGELEAPAQDLKIEDWKIAYYRILCKKSMQSVQAFCGEGREINIGEIMYASETMSLAVEKMDEILEYLSKWKGILLDSGKEDLFQRYFDLEIKAAKAEEEIEDIRKRIEVLRQFIQESDLYESKLVKNRFQEYDNYDFSAAPSEEGADTGIIEEEDPGELEEDCLSHILNYVSYSEEKIEEIRKMIYAYRDLPDIYSTDDDVRRLRKSLTTAYYEIYKLAIKRAFEEQKVSLIMKMFFSFGFIDASLSGKEQADQLYHLAAKISACRSDHVFTMFDWLKSIYDGENEPSRNEFDLDFVSYLAEQRKNGDITKAEQEEWKDDPWRKVEFEIENMFTSANRAVYGKISIFVPVLCEYDLINTAESMLVTAQRIDDALDVIREVDYSIFYRNATFSDPAHDIMREFLKKEVLPYVILMPNAGSNAMMWQETAGRSRDTSARFLFPILTTASLDELMVGVAGRFRWEMCRKEQGGRWNDIRELSLTSEYYDYIQFYRKNNDLSPEAKEKIKNAIRKAKNNYREVFVRDYEMWIRYESKGSFRMNRVSRGILFRYCPFRKKIRDSLKENPMYQEMIQKFDILQGREIRHMEVFMDKYRKAGGEMTPELLENQEFYSL